MIKSKSNTLIAYFFIIIIITEICCSCCSSVSSFPSLHEENPPNSAANAHILLYSDIGYANEAEYAVTESMVKRHMEYPFTFAISAGDNIQLKPALWGRKSMVNIWGDGGLDETFAKPFAPLIQAGIRFYAVLGNHDHQGLRRRIERNYSDRIDAEGHGLGGFVLPDSDYTMRRNGIKIVFLDVAAAFSTLNWSKQREAFARRELLSGDEKWKILIFHYPIWSSGEHGQDETLNDFRKVILPILNDCPVDFVFSGHDHHAELFYYQGKNKTRVVIVGNTARPHELPYEPDNPSIFRSNKSGFTEIDFQGNHSELIFRSVDGGVMFKDVIQK